MAEFLSQMEIDMLLDDVMEETEFPIYLYLKNPDGKYEILELEYAQAKDIVGEYELYQSVIKNKFENKKYEVLKICETKNQLVKYFKNRFDKLVEVEKEIAFMKEYMENHPEYLL